MKKVFKFITIMYVTMAIVVLSFILAIFSRCTKMNKSFESGNFIYCIRNGSANIRALTKLGKEQKYLVIPKIIDGRQVVSIKEQFYFVLPRCHFDSENVEKIYISHFISINESAFDSCLILRKIMLISNEAIPICFYGNENFMLFLPMELYRNIEKEKVNYSSGVRPANVSFMYNYENATNKGYYWADDIENGEKIELIPESPTREGYTFDGWYKESECNNKWIFEKDTVEKVSLEPTQDDSDKNASNISKEPDVEEILENFKETRLYAKWIMDNK